MSIQNIILILFAGATATAGILLSLTKNLVRALVLLFVVLLGTAALFILSGGDFIGVAQIILYVGGILIVLMFGVLLTQKARGVNPVSEWSFTLPAFAVAGVLFCILMWLLSNRMDFNFSEQITSYPPSTHEIGRNFLNEHLLAFELISLLLLVAMIGAPFLAREKSEKEETV